MVVEMSAKLTLEALEVLDAIDRKGSFAAAAASLYKVPSAITYTVSKLEEELGVSLFKKEGRRSLLTPAGHTLLDQGRELLLAAERIVEATRQVSSGWESRINIAVDTIIPLAAIFPVLDAFYELDLDVEVNLYDEVLGGAWEAVTEGRADLVIGAPEPPLNNQGLGYDVVAEVEWVFAVHPNHPLRDVLDVRGVLTQKAIQGYRAVVVRDSSRSLPPMTRRVFDKQAILRVVNLEQKIQAQVHGLGVGFLPRHRIESLLESGALIELPVEGDAVGENQMPIYLAWKKNNKGKALRWFIEAFKGEGGVEIE